MKLSDGRTVLCNKLLDLSEEEHDQLTVWLGLKNIPGSNGFEGSDQPGTVVIRLDQSGVGKEFEKADEKSYFSIKDRLVLEAVEKFEKSSGICLRDSLIEMEAASPLTWNRYTGEGTVNKDLADILHPAVQFAKVLNVIDRGHAKSFVIGPDPERGTRSLAYFRAGQYISILQKIGENTVCKPYSICSGPKDALGTDETTYTFMIAFSRPMRWIPGTLGQN